MDWVTVLLELVSQTPTPTAPPTAGVTVSTADGFSTLEIVLMSACGSLFTALSATAWRLFAWGNKIRDDNAKLFEEHNKAFLDLAKDQTADNKDTVHALKDVEKTLSRLVDRVERRGQERPGE